MRIEAAAISDLLLGAGLLYLLTYWSAVWQVVRLYGGGSVSKLWLWVSCHCGERVRLQWAVQAGDRRRVAASARPTPSHAASHG